MLLSEAIFEYLMFLKQNPTSKYTLKNYQFYLKKFLEFTGPKDLLQINLEDVNNYKNYLNTLIDQRTNETLKTSTKNYYLIALRSFINFYSTKNAVNLLPDEVELEKQPSRKVLLLDDDQIKLILKSPDVTSKEGLRDKLILELLYYTDLKAVDIIKLDRNSIKVGSLPEMNQEIIKTHEVYMLSRKDTFKPLFIRFQGVLDPFDEGEKMRLTERSIERIVKKHGQRAGIDNVTPQLIHTSTKITEIS